MLRSGVSAPREWLDIQMADRFHVLPWALEDAPADRYARCLRLLTIESEALTAMAGLAPDEEFYREDT